jgi:hypothetical protein
MINLIVIKSDSLKYKFSIIIILFCPLVLQSFDLHILENTVLPLISCKDREVLKDIFSLNKPTLIELFNSFLLIFKKNA